MMMMIALSRMAAGFPALYDFATAIARKPISCGFPALSQFDTVAKRYIPPVGGIFINRRRFGIPLTQIS